MIPKEVLLPPEGCSKPEEGKLFWQVMLGEVDPPENKQTRRQLQRHTGQCHVCRYKVLEQWAEEVFGDETEDAE